MVAISEAHGKVDLNVGLYVSTSVALIFLTKVLFKETQFPFALILTWLHIAGTGVILFVGYLLRFVGGKPVDFSSMSGISMGLCITSALCNMSLLYNSVTFHQLILLVHKVIYAYLTGWTADKVQSRSAKTALSIMVLGIVVSSMTSSDKSLGGAVIALLAAVSLSVYHYQISQKQRALHISPLQLLWHQIPASAVALLPILPLAEDVTLFFNLEWSVELVAVLIGTSILAAGSNITGLIAASSVSPLSLKLVENCQLLLIMVISYIAYGVPSDPVNVIFSCVALIGALLYSMVQLKEMEVNSKSTHNLPLARKKGEVAEKILRHDKSPISNQ